jgi:signal transduction histidine kinase
MMALAEGKTRFEYEQYVQSLKGRWKHQHVTCSVAPGCENTLARVFICVSDISELKKSKKQIKKYREHLEDLVIERTTQLTQEIKQREQAEQLLDSLYSSEHILRKKLETQINERIRFTRAVVHELKTPLTPLLGAIELLDSIIKQEPQTSLIKQVYYGATELNIRIDDLFDLTQNEVGLLKLHYKSIDTVELVEQTFKYFTFHAISSMHKLKLDFIKRAISAKMWGDPERIRQILFNLLDNAMRYSTRNTTVILKMRQNRKNFQFSVIDSGPGIAQSEVKKLFKPYARLQDYSEHYRGLGLGLSLCKMLVTMHQGRIWVTNTTTGGTCFSFTIPIEQPAGVRSNL